MLTYNKKMLENIISSYIFTVEDFKNLSKNITSFIKMPEKNLELLTAYLICIENEMIPVNNLNEINNLNETFTEISNLFSCGTLARKKEKIISNYNFKVYCGVLEYESYKDLENLYDEITEIIENTGGKTLRKFLGKCVNWNKYDRTQIKKITEEFLTINNEPAAMFKSDNLGLYSALLNYSNLDAERCNLKNIYPNAPDDWDTIAELFRKFLKEMGTRTIHY